MEKKGGIVFFLSILVVLSAAITIQFPSNPIPRSSVKTEIVIGSFEQEAEKPEADARVTKRHHILRWHNHTINLHLRNVRSRWLTVNVNANHLPVTYPEEDVRI